MPQSRNVRAKEISQHPEHTAERAGASHLNQSHERPQDNEHQHDKHVPQHQPEQSQDADRTAGKK